MADNQKSDSILSKLAVPITALGTGLLAVHRLGWTPKIARAFDMLHDITVSSKNWLPKKSFDNLTITDVKKSFDDVKDTYQSLKSDYESHPVRLNSGNSSLIGVVQEYQLARTRANEISNRIWRRTIADEGRKFVRDNFKDAAKTSFEKWDKFIERIVQNINNIQHIHDSIQHFDFNQLEQNVTLQILERMKSKVAEESDEAKRSLKSSIKNQVLNAFDAFLKVDNLEKVYGSKRVRNNESEFFQRLLNEQSITVRDLLESNDISTSNIVTSKQNRIERTDPIEILRKVHEDLKAKDIEQAERFLDIYVDKNRLKKSALGEIYSFSNADNVKEGLLDTLAGTLPGTILKLRSIQYARKAPVFQFIEAGTYDPVFAARTGSHTHEVMNNYIRINRNFYQLTSDGIEEVQGLDELRFISGKYGASARVMRQMMQDTDYAPSDNKFLRYFDLFQDREIYKGSNLIDRFLNIFSKENNPDWRGNVFRRFSTPTKDQRAEFDYALTTADIDYAMDYVSKANRVNNFFERNTYQLSNNAIEYLRQNTSNSTRELFDIIAESDNSKMLAKFIDYSETHVNFADGYHNLKLQKLLQHYIADTNETLNTIKLKTDSTHLNIDSQILNLFNTRVGNETYSIYDIFRTEIAKEAFLQYAQDSAPKLARDKNYHAILDLIQGMSFGKDKSNTERLAHLAVLQDKTGILNVGNKELTAEDLIDAMSHFEEVMNLSKGKSEDMTIRETFKELQREGISDFEGFDELYKESGGAMPYNDWIAINKTTGVLD